SSYNSADQGSIVIESLSQKSAVHRARDNSSPGALFGRPRTRLRAASEHLFAGVFGSYCPAGSLNVGETPENLATLSPLPEFGLKNVVDVHPDPADMAFVDFDLVQIRGGMHVSLGRAPVVLPEVGAQAVVQRPVDSFGVPVHAGALMSDHRLPGAQV